MRVALYAFATLAIGELDFEGFVKKYSRAYDTINDEKTMRKAIFEKNMAYIEKENAKGTNSYTLGVTDFADKTFEEFRSQLDPSMSQRKEALGERTNVFTADESKTVPDSIDWVAKGAVSAVKNQGQCGSCWSFSTTGALEGALVAKLHKPLTSLSEQNILNCDKVDQKCNGGLMDNAFKWVETNGVCSEESYPYECAGGSYSWRCMWYHSCPTSCTKVIEAGEITGFTDVKENSVSLKAAVAEAPVSVAVEADTMVFQHYTSGIITSDACGTQLDHGVLAVGYGVDNGTAYWKVKNSWGASWGEEGYLRIARGTPANESAPGICGIDKMASFPTVGADKASLVV